MSILINGMEMPIRTHADRIRAMTDEELANQLASEQYVATKQAIEAMMEMLINVNLIDAQIAHEVADDFTRACKERWSDFVQEKLDWLKQEAEEGE